MASSLVETVGRDNLIAGNMKISTEGVTVLTGQTLTRGAVIGIIAASGKAVLSLAASGDGSEVPYAIIAEDVDASAADVEAVAYLAGEFNQAAIDLGTGHTVASIKEGLREKGIFLKPRNPAG